MSEKKLNMSAEIRSVLKEHGMETKPAEVTRLLKKKYPRNKQVIDATSKKHFGISVSGIRRKMADVPKVSSFELKARTHRPVEIWDAKSDAITIGGNDENANHGISGKVYTVYEIACLAINSNLIEAVYNYNNLVRMIGDESKAVDVAKTFLS